MCLSVCVSERENGHQGICTEIITAETPSCMLTHYSLSESSLATAFSIFL